MIAIVEKETGAIVTDDNGRYLIFTNMECAEMHGLEEGEKYKTIKVVK